MPTTQRALLTELIDYAGIFPPAELPLADAFDNFLRHRGSEDGWFLARFVCPVARLDELASLMDAAELDLTPLRLTVLGAGGDDPPRFADALETDVEAMRAFIARTGRTAVLEAFEVKLPLGSNAADVADLCFHLLGDVAAHPPRPYFEIPLVGDWPDLKPIASAIASAAHEIDPSRRAGLKIRCGGLDAAAVPTVDAVAAAIAAALMSGLPLKATQGMHHPLRGHDPALATNTHGFFNLLTATTLAYEHFLDRKTINSIVAEEDPETFRLDDAGLHWRDVSAGFSSIVESRMAAFSGVGSCSFSEPRDDLVDLGWL